MNNNLWGQPLNTILEKWPLLLPKKRRLTNLEMGRLSGSLHLFLKERQKILDPTLRLWGLKPEVDKLIDAWVSAFAGKRKLHLGERNHLKALVNSATEIQDFKVTYVNQELNSKN